MIAEPPRTLTDMSLTVAQIEARLVELDNLLKCGHHDYAVAAEAKVRAVREREVKIAEAFGRKPGTPTERKQLAVAEVGNYGIDAEATYARLAADMEVIEHRIVTGAALLKSAKA